VEPERLELFAPTAAQQWLFDRLRRFNVLVCHRAFGKTVLAVNTLVRQAVTREQTAYAYIADTRKHCKDIAWDKVLKPAIQPLVDRGLVTVLESDLRVRFWNGSEITLYGAEHEHASALRGLHFDGVVFDEYALIAPGVWEQIVSPTIAKREGGAIFIGTPQGRNHFWSLYQKAQGWPDWFVTRIRADESGMVSAEELARQQTIQTPEQYAQEYECSFETAIAGAYYARELRATREGGRIKPIAWDPVLEVETWWDLGHTDATAIVFTQCVGPEIHVIDFIESSGKDLAWYAKHLRDRPYLYRAHHLPHDAEASQLSAAGQSIAMQFRQLRVGTVLTHPRQEPLEGITRARLVFPRCWFDAERTERLLDCLAFYHAQLDVKHQTEKAEPVHDWSSHAADAFRLMATWVRPRSLGALGQPVQASFNVYEPVPRRRVADATSEFDPWEWPR
jgi:phage terminase large subunit